MKYVIFDTETNGLPVRKSWDTYHNPAQYDKYYSNSRMLELAYILYEDGKEIKRYESLIIPDNYEINNSHIHGITTEMANTGKPIQEVLNQFERDLVGVDMLVGHNVLFDKNIVLAEAYRCGFQNLVRLIGTTKLACTMGLGKTHMNTSKSPKLIELYAYLFKKPLIQTHRAMDDVVATAKCFHRLMI